MNATTLGGYIRTRRESLGLTIAALAQRAEISYAVLYGVETRNVAHVPNPAVLARLAAALECQPDDLVRAAGYTYDRNFGETLFTR